jgi:hypothetical protein
VAERSLTTVWLAAQRRPSGRLFCQPDFTQAVACFSANARFRYSLTGTSSARR